MEEHNRVIGAEKASQEKVEARGSFIRVDAINVEPYGLKGGQVRLITGIHDLTNTDSSETVV